MKKVLGCLMLLSLPVAGQASEVRNGGNATVCYQNATRQQIVSVEDFDYWEMKQLHPELGVPVASNASVEEIITASLARMAVFSPTVAAEYLKQAIQIAKNINYYLEDVIPVVLDDNSPLIPTAPCFKEQYAVQTANPLAGERRFLVNRKLYTSPRNTNLNRAAIILHEVIYRDAVRRYKHHDSDGSRLLNYAIATPFLQKASSDQFESVLNFSKMPSGLSKFFVEELGAYAYVASNSNASYKAILERPMVIGQNSLGLVGTLSVGSRITHDPKREITDVFAIGAGDDDMAIQLNQGVLPISYYGVRNDNHMPGVVVYIPHAVQMKAYGKVYSCQEGEGTVQDGNFAGCRLTAGTHTVTFTNGKSATLPSGQGWRNAAQIGLSANGKVNALTFIDTKNPFNFQVAGIPLNLNPQILTLNDQGQIIFADHVEGPMSQGISYGKGKISLVGRIYANGKEVTSERLTYETAFKVNNLDVIYSNSQPAWDFIRKWCDGHSQRLGMAGALYDVQAESTSRQIVGTESFYSIDRKKVVTSVDDEVHVLSNVKCVFNNAKIKKEFF